MPTKSGIIGTVKIKMEDGTFVDLPAPISLEEITTFAEQYEFVRVVRCGKCRHYQGNHDVPGCAPCDFWGIGGVMWDDFCKRGERNDA